VISEDKLKYPFDLNHITINKYAHSGQEISLTEIERFRGELSRQLRAVLARRSSDSPVFTFLPFLPPHDLKMINRAMRAGEQKIVESDAPAGVGGMGDGRTLAFLVGEAERAVDRGDFNSAAALFRSAWALCENIKDGAAIKDEAYLLQRLALSTYKAEHPDKISALQEAMKVLAPLKPEESHDPETVGLAGAIHKRLFESEEGPEHLEMAIRYYTRGYYLRNDWYNGINLSYLLTVRADVLARNDQERIADLVWANRIRREVLALCYAYLRDLEERDPSLAAAPDEIKRERAENNRKQRFWCLATKAEAHLGLGEVEMFEPTRAEAIALQPADWMMRSFNEQVGKLRKVLQRHGHLLDPPWREEPAPA
jgi:hypothetical protein